MGHRANLILVENKEPKIYYSHRAAQNTPEILAQGLAFCDNYFKQFNEDGWLMDNAFAEGGILIDKDNKRVLIFGGGDISYTPALQRLYAKYMSKTWQDWIVEWSDSGNVGFAEYLGLMEDRILADGTQPDFFDRPEWSYTMEKDRNQDEVITIIDKGIIKDYKQDWGLDGIEMCLVKGEVLKDIIPEELIIEKWHNEIETTDCMLADYDSKKIFVCWGSEKDKRHDDEIRRIWKGWEVNRQTDGLIFHFEYTKRDKSVIEMTSEQFEMYWQKNRLFEFDPEK